MEFVIAFVPSPPPNAGNGVSATKDRMRACSFIEEKAGLATRVIHFEIDELAASEDTLPMRVPLAGAMIGFISLPGAT